MAQNSLMQYQIVVIGGSAGSLEVIIKLLSQLQGLPGVAIVIVLHRKPAADSILVELLAARTDLPVTEAEEKELILPDHVYVAPPDYHLLIESDKSFALDTSEKIYFSRPAIDATFESAAEVYGEALIGVLLSGANADGAQGLLRIKECGGLCIVQDPVTAEVPYMPEQAIAHAHIDKILDTEQLIDFINSLSNSVQK
ncbi:MAG: chemotaxis protein CheB [Chitinophagaceae bacterium]